MLEVGHVIKCKLFAECVCATRLSGKKLKRNDQLVVPYNSKLSKTATFRYKKKTRVIELDSDDKSRGKALFLVERADYSAPPFPEMLRGLLVRAVRLDENNVYSPSSERISFIIEEDSTLAEKLRIVGSLKRTKVKWEKEDE